MGYRFHIAIRYLFARKSHNVINIVSAVSMGGIAVGTAALVIILSVLNGFNALIVGMISPVEPDFAITASQGKFFSLQEAVIDSLKNDPDVKSVCKTLQDNAFLSYDGRQATAVVKGVEGAYARDGGLDGRLVDGEFRLRKGDIPYAAVGAGLAARLALNIRFIAGIDLYYPDHGAAVSLANPMASINSVRVYPACRFSLSNDLDNTLLITDLDLMRELTGCDDELSSVEIRVRDGMTIIEKERLRQRLKAVLEALSGENLKILDRYEQNPDLYRMMRMEKASVYLIMLFVVIILGFSIFGSLSLLLIDKRRDIQTLKSLGAGHSDIRRIFTVEATMVTVCGMLAGLVLGTAFSLLQQWVGIVPMPGNFVVDYYPLVLEWTDLLVAAAGISFTGWITARLSTRLV